MRSISILLVSFTIWSSSFIRGNCAVNITFSGGGGGSALTMTIPSDITFTGLTLSSANVGVVIVAANAGNTTVTTFSHTGTSNLAGINNSDSGAMGFVNFGSITDEDVVAVWQGGDISDTGGSVVLSAGTRTSTGVMGGLAPTSGSYTIRLANTATGAFIGNEGTQAVPEPHHYAILSSTSLGLLAFVWRVRRRGVGV